MWKGLKDMIFEAEPEKKAPPAAATPAAPQASAPPIEGESSGKLALNVAHVQEGIDMAIRSKPEFEPVVKFLEAVDSLKDVPGMDEATRFRAALATTKIPVLALQAAIATHADVLTSETDRFNSTFVSNVSAAITGAGDQIAQLKSEVVKAQQRLDELSQQHAQLIRDTNTQANDLEKAKIDFAQIVKDVGARYTDLGAKITKHLGA